MNRIDLHTHSNYSDGTTPPEQLVHLASEAGLAAIALTDHDNTNGLARALSAAADCRIEVIPGIEFSTEYLGHDIHILGLEFDWENPGFQEEIEAFRQERTNRNRRMIRRMADDGIDISFEQMAQAFGDGVWTRAHFGRYLMDHGYVRTIQEAFESLIGENGKYFVPRRKITPFDAVRLIRRFSGIPVLAHPFQYPLSPEELTALVSGLKDAGMIGIEAWYSLYDEEQTARLLALAEEFHLAPSGGSDFHGSNKPHIALGTGTGHLDIPYAILDGLRKKYQEEAHHANR